MLNDLKSSRYRLAILSILLAVVLLAPFVGNLYHIHLVTLMATYWMLISTLTMLVGYTGQLSIGHAGILAIGAYAYSILTGQFDCNAFLAIAAAGGICGLCGFLLGLPSLRLPGFYFALATIAFAVIVGENIISWGSLTGGGTGLLVTELPDPLNTPEALYWLSIGIAIAVTFLCHNLARSMWGRNMIAVRDSEVAALSVGIAPFRTKLTVFVFAGVFAGVSGAFFALTQNYILPESFHFDLSLSSLSPSSSAAEVNCSALSLVPSSFSCFRK
jgi:ABC-type branched-subunit amino acid transport system permease subunit